MKELVRYIVAALVDHPDEVKVTEVRGEHSAVVELKVHPDDLGRVIGRQGRTASAIRAILGVAAARSRQRAILEIVEEEAGRARADRGAEEGEDDAAEEAPAGSGPADDSGAGPIP